MDVPTTVIRVAWLTLYSGTAGRRCHVERMTGRDPTKLALNDWIAEPDISEAEVALVLDEAVLAKLK